MLWFAQLAALGLALALAACPTVANQPLNVLLADWPELILGDGPPSAAAQDDVLVALVFSGGGTRARR